MHTRTQRLLTHKTKSRATGGHAQGETVPHIEFALNSASKIRHAHSLTSAAHALDGMKSSRRACPGRNRASFNGH
eukprot:524825-Pelagomonas_calceolata.AAC.3